MKGKKVERGDIMQQRAACWNRTSGRFRGPIASVHAVHTLPLYLSNMGDPLVNTFNTLIAYFAYFADMF